MGLNDTVSAERIHIGFFGLRNAGKSSVVNALTGQNMSIVSEVKGTTTDPVKKAMEILPLGPVVIIDTPGLDDCGELGRLRVEKTRQILARTDIAVLVVDAVKGMGPVERELLAILEERQVPYIIAYNKADLLEKRPVISGKELYVSAVTTENISALREMLADFAKTAKKERYLVADLLSPGDRVVLVTPMDESAPKGRLILPQQQTIRELLDAHCVCTVCQPEELDRTLAACPVMPRLVITDSQAFERAAEIVPENVWLTSFSILFARYKGNLKTLAKGAARLSRLKDGDRVLIAEGCTHHRQCNDIGSVKLPGWIRGYSRAKPEFVFSSGTEFGEELFGYALVVHCGGCMLNKKEMEYRISLTAGSGVPIVNYGIAIAQMHGILERSLRPFPDVWQQIHGLLYKAL